uniref:Putative secreted peptide n=1 Tax=Anopheles braziliensis TaxID=58242 RepID=A0A2M3ZRK7_9DIPT
MLPAVMTITALMLTVSAHHHEWRQNMIRMICLSIPWLIISHRKQMLQRCWRTGRNTTILCTQPKEYLVPVSAVLAGAAAVVAVATTVAALVVTFRYQEQQQQQETAAQLKTVPENLYQPQSQMQPRVPSLPTRITPITIVDHLASPSLCRQLQHHHRVRFRGATVKAQSNSSS